MKKHVNRKIKKVLFCAAAIIVTGVPAVFLNSVYGYLPVLVVVSAIIISLIYLKILKRSINFTELSDLESCSRGTRVEFTVKVINRSFLVFPQVDLYFYISDLFGDEDTVTESTITLAPRETRQFDFSVRFDHIGTYSAGIRKLRIHDLLGLFQYEMMNPREYVVNVAPHIYDIADINISHKTLTENQKPMIRTVTDGTDYAGVREYVWGDPIKFIHWKLSARTENYMTKQFESYGVTGISIILDFTAPVYDAETLMCLFDGVVETALSIARYAEDESIEYELIYKDRKGLRKRETGGRFTDYMGLISDMPRISTDDDSFSGTDLLRDECNSIYSQGNIAYCTANPTAETADLMIAVKNKKKNPLPYIIVPENLSDNERSEAVKPVNMLGSAGIPFCVLTSAAQLGGGERQ
ncbi:MAG: DUF58 domain-containing protein [Lentihominibacter sp.]